MKATTIFEYNQQITFHSIYPYIFDTGTTSISINGIQRTIGNTGDTSVDFGNIFTGYGVCRLAINNPSSIIFHTGDVVRLDIYADSTKTGTPVQTAQTTVLPVYSYVELIAPSVSNGIKSTETTDKSSILNDPTKAGFIPCETTNINAHVNPRPSLLSWDNDSSIYKVNGVNIASTDVDFTDTGVAPIINNGIISNKADTFKVFLPLVISYPYKLEIQDDGTFQLIDNQIMFDDANGFEKINSNSNNDTSSNNTYQIRVNGVTDPTVYHAPTNSSTFGIEATQTMFNWYVDGQLVHSENRTVQYSSTNGTVSNSAIIPYQTPVVFTAGSNPSGIITAIMNGVTSIQKIQVTDNQSATISPAKTCYSINDVITVSLANIASGVAVTAITGSGGLIIGNIDLVNKKFTITGGTSGSVNITLSCNSKVINVPVSICANSATLVDDTNTTTVNTPVSGSVIGNDTVVCSGTTTYDIVSGSSTNGTFTIDNTGTYTFTPSPNFIGIATAKYEVKCNGTTLSTANISVTVTCPTLTYLPPIVACGSDNTTNTITVKVSGNNSAMTEFHIPTNVGYLPATSGTDTFTFPYPANGDNIPVSARVVGCTNDLGGFVTSYTKDYCDCINPIYSNEQIVIKAQKSDCQKGQGTVVDYTVQAGIITNRHSIAEANWIAYSQNLINAQLNANTNGTCIVCKTPSPCILEASNGSITGTSAPSDVIRVYNRSGLLFTTVADASGNFWFNSPYITGTLYVTAESVGLLESNMGCGIQVKKNCVKVQSCSTSNCGSC